MNLIGFMPYYAVWHYSGALADIYRIWRNYLWFFYHFFSIPVLLKTLFVPWRRLQEEYKGGFNLESFFATIIVNIMMRFVGALVRLVFIIVGSIILAGVFFAGLAFMLVWITVPVLSLGLLVLGPYYLIHG